MYFTVFFCASEPESDCWSNAPTLLPFVPRERFLPWFSPRSKSLRLQTRDRGLASYFLMFDSSRGYRWSSRVITKRLLPRSSSGCKRLCRDMSNCGFSRFFLGPETSRRSRCRYGREQEVPSRGDSSMALTRRRNWSINVKLLTFKFLSCVRNMS